MEIYSICWFKAPLLPSSPPPQAAEQGTGLHIHPGHAGTHTHTALLYYFFFLSKKIKIYCPLKKKSILPLETVTQIEFFPAPHANSLCQEKSLNQVSDSQNTYLQSTRERQLKSQFYTWNQQHVLHTTDHHSANFYTD